MQQRERVLQHPAGPSTARRVRADPSVPNQSAAVCQTGKLRRNPFAQLMGEDVDNDEVSPLARPVAVLPKQNEVEPETASANALARLTPAGPTTTPLGAHAPCVTRAGSCHARCVSPCVTGTQSCHARRVSAGAGLRACAFDPRQRAPPPRPLVRTRARTGAHAPGPPTLARVRAHRAPRLA